MAADDGLEQPELSARVETVIVDQDDNPLAFIRDASIWPPIGAKVELGEPNRDAVVREVTLRLFPGHASIQVRIRDLGQVVPGESAA